MLEKVARAIANFVRRDAEDGRNIARVMPRGSMNCESLLVMPRTCAIMPIVTFSNAHITWIRRFCYFR